MSSQGAFQGTLESLTWSITAILTLAVYGCIRPHMPYHTMHGPMSSFPHSCLRIPLRGTQWVMLPTIGLKAYPHTHGEDMGS